MNRAFSTHFFRNHRLTIEQLEQVAARVGLVEIFCVRPHFDWRDRNAVLALRTWFRDSKLQLHSLHSPMSADEMGGRGGARAIVNLAEPEKIHRRDSVDEVKRALETSEEIPFRYLIQHLGMPYQEWDMRFVDAIFASLSELNVFAKHRGVEILVENIPNELSSASALLKIMDVTRLQNDFCFDTGHANIQAKKAGGYVEEEFEMMKTRIRSTHVHDNNGEDDNHLFPMVTPVDGENAGTIDWNQTMDLLRSAPDQYPLMLELREAAGVSIDHVNEVFNRLDEARQPERER